MADNPVTLEPAGDTQLGYVADLLERCDLPTADLREEEETFYVASLGVQVVGVGGLEAYGADGLLRSVAVEPAVRGQGLGGSICDALEAEADSRGVETLYLLTTTAADFFAARGYERIDRETVPEPIASTSEFVELCPDSATCMRLSL